jgi:hypothetical protein
MVCVGIRALARIQVFGCADRSKTWCDCCSEHNRGVQGETSKVAAEARQGLRYGCAPRDSYMRLRVGGGRRCFVGPGLEASKQAVKLEHARCKMNQGRGLESETTTRYKADTPGYRAQQTQHGHGTERVKRAREW